MISMISILNNRNRAVANDIRDSIVSSIIAVVAEPAAESEDPEKS